MYSAATSIKLPNSLSDQSIHTLLEQFGVVTSACGDKDQMKIHHQLSTSTVLKDATGSSVAKFDSYKFDDLEFEDGDYINNSMKFDYSNNVSSIGRDNQLPLIVEGLEIAVPVDVNHEGQPSSLPATIHDNGSHFGAQFYDGGK